MRLIFAAALLCLFAFPAQAGFQHPWDAPSYSARKTVKVVRVKKQRVVRRGQSPGLRGTYFDSPQSVAKGVVSTAKRLVGVATSALPTPLQNALRQVAASCSGFRVISAHRPGARIAGTGRPSLHASGRAADFVVRDYSCAYAILRSFPGGVSMDASRVSHIHVSYAPNGQEWGARFNHGGRAYAKRSKYRRYARRNGRRT